MNMIGHAAVRHRMEVCIEPLRPCHIREHHIAMMQILLAQTPFENRIVPLHSRCIVVHRLHEPLRRVLL